MKQSPCSVAQRTKNPKTSLCNPAQKNSLARHCLCLDITTILSAAIFQRAAWKSSSPAPSHAMMSVTEGSDTAVSATHTRSRQGLPLLSHTSSPGQPRTSQTPASHRRFAIAGVGYAQKLHTSRQHPLPTAPALLSPRTVRPELDIHTTSAINKHEFPGI